MILQIVFQRKLNYIYIYIYLLQKMCIHELFIPFCDRHDIHFTRKEYNFAFEVWFLNNKSFREI